MLKFINKRIAFQWIILVGLFSLALFKIFSQSQIINVDGNMFLFKSFASFFSQHLLFGKIVLSFLLVFQIILLQLFYSKNDLSSKFSLLPACFFLIGMLITKSLTDISPSFFTTLFLLVNVSIEQEVSSDKLKRNIFWMGVTIAIATAFDQNSIVLVFLAMTTLFINQFSKFKEIAILFFGFILVYIYISSYYFLTNQLYVWIEHFSEIKIMKIIDKNLFSNPFHIVSVLVISILYIYFIIRIKLIGDTKVVVQRKRIFTLNIWALLLLFCFFLSNSSLTKGFNYLLVPISIYLAFFSKEKNPFFINEIVTIVIFIALCI